MDAKPSISPSTTSAIIAFLIIYPQSKDSIGSIQSTIPSLFPPDPKLEEFPSCHGHSDATIDAPPALATRELEAFHSTSTNQYHPIHIHHQ
jgi:hypothetical protein